VKLVPLGGRPEIAVRLALLSHGWEGDLSLTASRGLEALAFEITGADPAVLQDLVATGGRLGLDILTGDGWGVIAGPRARLASLARPGIVPPSLADLAVALGHSLPADEPRVWQTRSGPIPLDQPVIMGILNVTPDSFSDGSRFAEPEAALRQAERLLQAGARILDIGGESTRPGAVPVGEAEERRRVLPVLEAVRRAFPGALISIDTTKAGVARDALAAGASIVNDVSGLRHDPAMAGSCAEDGAGVVVMHSRGGPGDLASDHHADYPGGVLSAVLAELGQSLELALRAGLAADHIVLDPGLGFGKTAAQSLELLRGLGVLRALGRPVLIGPSRKRFLGALTGRPVEERDVATAAACAMGWIGGARIFRVHEPGPVKDALALAAAVAPR
jgi:dihydropteroate synthase